MGSSGSSASAFTT